jgi:ABC-type Fe3+/spermidine/putrescine transport system ATPase subunit
LTVSFGDVLVLDDLDLEVARAETVALLGPSGSGKTSLLYAIAGLLEPTAGEIEVDGNPMRGGPRAVAPELRSVGMVFQNYALWPHLSAAQTVAYPMRQRGVSEAEAEAMVDRLLATLGIGELADRLPDQLSGGQQQRVGLARALAAEPALFLFDEPTAHLDAALRITLQQELMVQRDLWPWVIGLGCCATERSLRSADRPRSTANRSICGRRVSPAPLRCYELGR